MSFFLFDIKISKTAWDVMFQTSLKVAEIYPILHNEIYAYIETLFITILKKESDT